MIVLTNNQIERLQDIDALASLPKLKYLSLLENPIARKKNYRLYTISRLPSLKWLDFKRVKQGEREAAQDMFGQTTTDASGARTFVPGQGLELMEEDEEEPNMEAVNASSRKGKAAAHAPTPEQLMALKAAIAAAQTLEEVQIYEEALRTGKLPSHMGGGDGEEDEDGDD